jgi:hypothetical protein
LLALEAPAFPTYSDTCANATGRVLPPQCIFYFTQRDVTNPDTENEFLGMLKPYVFASAETTANIEAGPEKIAQEAIGSGVFAQCTVNKMWSLLLARDASIEEAAIIEELAADFGADFSLKRLIKAIVTRPEYVGGAK